MSWIVAVVPHTPASVAAPPIASALSVPTPAPPRVSCTRSAVQGDSGVKKCAAKAVVCDILKESMRSLHNVGEVGLNFFDSIEFLSIYPSCFFLGC